MLGIALTLAGLALAAFVSFHLPRLAAAAVVGFWARHARARAARYADALAVPRPTGAAPTRSDRRLLARSVECAIERAAMGSMFPAQFA